MHKRPVPPAVFVEPKLITAPTVEHYCPNDSLMQTGLPGTVQLIKVQYSLSEIVCLSFS